MSGASHHGDGGAVIAVIGASGFLGSRVVAQAAERGQRVLAVSRSPLSGLPAHVQQRVVSEYSAAEVATAIAGASRVIATVGLPYRARLWEHRWVPMITAIADAAERNAAHLIVLDNLYAWGAPSGPLTENSPEHPASRKGRVRKLGADALRALSRTQSPILLARAADFLGPGAENSILPWRQIQAVAAGERQSLQALGDPQRLHSYGASTQVARALVDLSYDRAEHPTGTLLLPAVQAFSVQQLGAAITQRSGHRVRLRSLSATMIAGLSLVSSRAREQKEMMYQVTEDFLVDDSAFRTLYPGYRSLTVADIASWASPH